MIKRVWLASALTALASTGVQADLEPISDSAMSDVTGQAFVSVDRTYHPDESQSTAYTRVNLGMDIDIQTNIDVLELGRYERDGEREGSSDLLIEDFALGYINNQAYYDANTDAAQQFKPDGTPYAEGEIVPFQISNPFFEFAFDEATNEVVGVRLGFGESMGMLSGTIKSLTGNINVDIIDTGESLGDATSNGTLFDRLIKLLTPALAGDSPLSTKAQLLHGPDSDTPGELDPVRAQYIGVPNGEQFVLEGVSETVAGLIETLGAIGLLSSELEAQNCVDGHCDVVVTAQNCEVLGIMSCFPLSQYNSIPVGQIESDADGSNRRFVGPEDGMFLSFQTKDLDWVEDIKNTSPGSQDFIRTTSGAFFNIPNGAVELNLTEALNGIDRRRTEYIDRGRGLF